MEIKELGVDISMLRIFLATARSQTMSDAAKKLGITQPAVSSTISKLERALGVSLFDRSQRPIRITTAGRVLINSAERIVHNLSQLTAEVHKTISTPEIDLRLGFSDSFGGCIGPDLLCQIIRKINNLSAYTASTPRIIEKLRQNEIDIAIATRNMNEEPGITSYFLFTERFLVVTPKEFEGKLRSIGDLEQAVHNLPVIRFNDESLDAIQVERVLRQVTACYSKKIEADTNSSVLGLVKHGCGWTVMPPLGIWMARDQAHNVAYHDITSATRSFYLQFKDPLFERYATFIASESRRILKDLVLKHISVDLPILGRYIHLEPVSWPSTKII